MSILPGDGRGGWRSYRVSIVGAVAVVTVPILCDAFEVVHLPY